MPSKNRKRKAASFFFYKHIQEIKSILYVKVVHNLQYFLASFVKCVHCFFFKKYSDARPYPQLFRTLKTWGNSKFPIADALIFFEKTIVMPFPLATGG